jgi:hypothetical protein
MQNPLKIAPPPRRPAGIEAQQEPAPRAVEAAEPKLAAAPRRSAASAAVKFRQVKEDERVQFNKRVTRRVADGFEMLAIRSRKKVPALLAEALELLEERYGKIG